MSVRRAVLVLALVLFATAALFAGSGTPLTATFLANDTAIGVTGDGNGTYANGTNGVQCYLGVAGKDLDLVTYNTGRKLHFKFDTSSPAWQASGLPAELDAEADFYGINFFGPYASMGAGTTAQVHGTLQFHLPNSPYTWELDYQSLAAKRDSANPNIWHVTSNPNDIGGFPGFTASNQAALGAFRKRTKQTFGAVNMSIRFDVKLQ